MKRDDDWFWIDCAIYLGAGLAWGGFLMWLEYTIVQWCAA